MSLMCDYFVAWQKVWRCAQVYSARYIELETFKEWSMADISTVAPLEFL